jgi:hypothetical protein
MTEDYVYPEPLPKRERKPRGTPINVGQSYLPDIGYLNELRGKVNGLLQSQNAPRLNLQEQIAEINYRRDNPTPKAPPRQRRLPEKNTQALQSLFNVVADLKQDVRLIKDAQSKAGAEDWIQRNGLEDHLFVDDRDIDGDNVPDIIVRRRAANPQDRTPYIIKGYTTDPSKYPLKNKYYSQYPLAADRVGHSYQDFLDYELVQGYGDHGYTRNIKPEYQKVIEDSRAKGYGIRQPRKNLTNNQVFKHFIMKPLMNVYREVLKTEFPNAKNTGLDGLVVRNLEAAIRDNLVTVPVMVKVYGEEILNTDKENWRKLSQRKEVKEGCKFVLQELVSRKNTNEVITPLVEALIDFLAQTNSIPAGVDPNELKEFMAIQIEESKYWNVAVA